MEQVLNTCCGFLHDMNPESEQKMIERFLSTKAGLGFEASGIKRRAFLVTSVPVEGSHEFLPGRYIQTMTPWDPEKVKGNMPESSHHVGSYNAFKKDLILGKTVFNIAGFDGDVTKREESFVKIDSERPDLPHLCILSNKQHEIAEPFLLKHGYTPVCRGQNQFWYDNHLTVFVKPATKTREEVPGGGGGTEISDVGVQAVA